MKTAYKSQGVKIYQGDALEVLRRMPDSYVHCCVTSPPYWGLRQYFFNNASVIRDDISLEDRKYVEEEIKKRGIAPRIQAP